MTKPRFEVELNYSYGTCLSTGFIYDNDTEELSIHLGEKLNWDDIRVLLHLLAEDPSDLLFTNSSGTRQVSAEGIKPEHTIKKVVMNVYG